LTLFVYSKFLVSEQYLNLPLLSPSFPPAIPL
jgi:hypothetical protein